MLKKSFIVLILFIILNPITHAETNLLNHVKSCFRGPFESYDTWLNLLSLKKKKFNPTSFQKRFPLARFEQVKAAVECIDFQYQVDGITVEGYMLKPKNVANRKLPVIINNRGGNGSYGYVVFARKLEYLADLAMAGYIVIGSQYRGSSRRIKNNGYDEFGGKDIDDVVTLVDVIKSMPEADSKNIALMGWSRGAMQSFIAAQQIPELKTLVAIAGNSDLNKAIVWRPQMEKVYRKRMPNYQQNKEAVLKQRSVITWLDKLPKNMPILLIHGDKDTRVNVEQSTVLSAKLTTAGHPHKLVIYANDNHSLVQHRNELTQELNLWFKQHLL